MVTREYCQDSERFPRGPVELVIDACAVRRRAQNQFAAAIPNVASTTTPSFQRTVVSSKPVKTSATTANAMPPDNRKAASPGLFRRKAGKAAATAPYMNRRATAAKLHSTENPQGPKRLSATL